MKYKAAKKVRADVDRTLLPKVLTVAFLVLLPFFISIDGLDKFRVPKDIFSTLAILAILLVTVFVVRPRFKLALWSWETLLLAAALFVALHTLVSSAPAVSWAAFLHVALFVGLFFCWRPLSTAAFQQLAWLLVGTSFGVNAIILVMQYYGLVPFMMDSRGEAISGRMNAAGLIGEVNSGGFLFGLVSLLMLYSLVAGKTRGPRVVAGILLGLNLLGLAYSRTLTAVFALAVALFVWLLFHHWWVLRQTRRVTRTLVIFWTVLLAGAGVGLLAGYYSGVLGRVAAVGGSLQRGSLALATAGRMPLFELTWKMIRQDPWVGRGLNTFGRDFFFFRAETEEGQSIQLISQPGAFREVHNEYLQVWEELGLTGLVLLVGILFLPLLVSLRAITREPDVRLQYWTALLSCGVVFLGVSCLAFFPLRLSVTGAYVVFLFAGLRHAQASESEDLWRTEPSSLGWRSAVVSLALVLFALFVASARVQLWAANQDAGTAVLLLERASQIPPPQKQLLAGEALRRLEKHQSVAPALPELSSLQGGAQVLLGRYDEAVRLYQEASRAIPSPEVFTNLAAAHLGREESDKAREYVALALKYDAGYGKAIQVQNYLDGQPAR